MGKLKQNWILNIIILLLILAVSFSVSIKFIMVRDVYFNYVYQQIIGFSETDEIRKPIKSDIILFRNQCEWDNFKSMALKELPIPDIDASKKDIVFIQEAWQNGTQGPLYYIKDIKANVDTFNVYIEKNGLIADVDSTNSEAVFKNVIIATVDKDLTYKYTVPKLYIEE